jgi:hypothetical protein
VAETKAIENLKIRRRWANEGVCERLEITAANWRPEVSILKVLNGLVAPLFWIK